jgi:hypothetical protein
MRDADAARKVSRAVRTVLTGGDFLPYCCQGFACDNIPGIAIKRDRCLWEG